MAGFCLAASLAAYLADRPFTFVVATSCGFFAAGAALGSEANSRALRSPLVQLYDCFVPPQSYQLFATIEGQLRADAVVGPNGTSLTIDVDRFILDGRRWITSGGAVVGIGGQPESSRVDQWRTGRRIRIPATLHKPSRFMNQGVADSQREFGWRGVALVGSSKSDRLVEMIAQGSLLDELLSSGRAWVRREIVSSVGDWSAQSAAVVTAILIGDRAGLDDDMQRELQEAGTYHVIAISGGNIAIVAGLCLFVFRCASIGPRASAALVMIALSAYGLLAEGGSSVARAVTMALIYFGARLIDHRSSPVNVVATSAAVLFSAVPLVATDAAFALTFGATLGLVTGMSRLIHPDAGPRWMLPVATLFLASLCAEVALLPIAALTFSRVTIAGLVLNFAAIPLMSVVQVAGMTAVALASITLPAARAAGFIAHLGVRGLVESAALVNLAPWTARRVPPPSIWIIALYYSALIAAINLPKVRRIGAAVVVGCAAWIWSAPNFGTLDRTLRVTFIDVGQGDAALVQCPDGRTLSIDAGGLASSTFDIGGRVVSPAFWASGARRLDYMSVTHGDPDHIGGALSLFRDFHPSEIWYGVPVPRHEPTSRLREVADAAGVPWRTLRTGDHLEIGAVQLLVHHPPAPDWERQRVRNDDSEVVELRYGGVSFVFTGDIGAEVERTIAGGFDPAPIRILKVPHHGSSTSSSAAFLSALSPKIAVISAGRGNPFGHPTQMVLDRYRDAGAAIFRTDLDGEVVVETDGNTMRLRTFTNRRLTLRAGSR